MVMESNHSVISNYSVIESNYSSKVNAVESTCHSVNRSGDPFKQFFYSGYNYYILIVGIPIVVLMGVLGNLSLLYVFCRIKRMRNITNFYLANLAIADVGVLMAASVQYFGSYLYSAPFDVSQIGYTFRTPIGCALPHWLNYAFYFASVWFVTVVATERFLAVNWPLKHRMVKGKRRALRLVFAVWFISFSIASLAGNYAGIQEFCLDGPSGGVLGDNMPRYISQCVALCAKCNLILWTFDTCLFFAALVGTTVMYTVIIYTLSKHTDLLESGNNHSCASARRKKKNRDLIAKMLIISAIVFFICLSPYMIINIIDIRGITIKSDIKKAINWLARAAYLTNSTCNPYIYNGVNRQYRRAFCEAFGLRKREPKNLSRTGTLVVSHRKKGNHTAHV